MLVRCYWECQREGSQQREQKQRDLIQSDRERQREFAEKANHAGCIPEFAGTAATTKPLRHGCNCQRLVAMLNFAPSMFGYAQHCPKMNG